VSLSRPRLSPGSWASVSCAQADNRRGVPRLRHSGPTVGCPARKLRTHPITSHAFPSGNEHPPVREGMSLPGLAGLPLQQPKADPIACRPQARPRVAFKVCTSYTPPPSRNFAQIPRHSHRNGICSPSSSEALPRQARATPTLYESSNRCKEQGPPLFKRKPYFATLYRASAFPPSERATAGQTWDTRPEITSQTGSHSVSLETSRFTNPRQPQTPTERRRRHRLSPRSLHSTARRRLLGGVHQARLPSTQPPPRTSSPCPPNVPSSSPPSSPPSASNPPPSRPRPHPRNTPINTNQPPPPLSLPPATSPPAPAAPHPAPLPQGRPPARG
jgi:hypothetical protein